MMSASFFSGPLPPADELAKYEVIQPGITNRLITLHEKTLGMAHGQSEHRQGLESRVIDANIGNERRGQWMAFWIIIATVAAGTYLIATGRKVEGLTAMFGPLAAVLGIFFIGRSKQDKELEQKRQEIAEAHQPRSG